MVSVFQHQGVLDLEAAGRLREYIGTQINTCSKHIRELQADLCARGVMRELLQLSKTRHPEPLEALGLLCYRNRIVVQQLVSMGVLQLIEQVLVHDAESGTAPLQLQCAAMQLLTSLLAFNLEVHSTVMATNLVVKLVQLCRYDETSASVAALEEQQVPPVGGGGADGVSLAPIGGGGVDDGSCVVQPPGAAADAAPHVQPGHAAMAACAATALRNLCHQESNHASLLAAGAATELAAVMQRERDPYRRINAAMAVALLVGHEEQHPLLRLDAILARDTLEVLDCACDNRLCHNYFWTCWKVCQALARLTANDDNKPLIFTEGGVGVLARVLLSDSHTKAITQKYCIESLWNLAFYEPCRLQIRENAALIHAVQQHAVHTPFSNDLVREVARGCLFTLGVLDMDTAALLPSGATRHGGGAPGGGAAHGGHALAEYTAWSSQGSLSSTQAWPSPQGTLTSSSQAWPEVSPSGGPAPGPGPAPTAAAPRHYRRGSLDDAVVRSATATATPSSMHPAMLQRCSTTTRHRQPSYISQYQQHPEAYTTMHHSSSEQPLTSHSLLHNGSVSGSSQSLHVLGEAGLYGAAPPPPMTPAPGGHGHLMISYEWASQQKALLVKEELERRGYTIWMDVDKMSGSMLEAMAAAVEGSVAVLLCVTKRYKESQACRAEAEYAYQQRKRIVPIIFEAGYNPTGWLGILVGAKLYFDLSDRRLIPDRIGALERELGGLARLCRRPGTAGGAAPAAGAGAGPGHGRQGSGSASLPPSVSGAPALRRTRLSLPGELAAYQGPGVGGGRGNTPMMAAMAAQPGGGANGNGMANGTGAAMHTHYEGDDDDCAGDGDGPRFAGRLCVPHLQLQGAQAGTASRQAQPLHHIQLHQQHMQPQQEHLHHYPAARRVAVSQPPSRASTPPLPAGPGGHHPALIHWQPSPGILHTGRLSLDAGPASQQQQEQQHFQQVYSPQYQPHPHLQRNQLQRQPQQMELQVQEPASPAQRAAPHTAAGSQRADRPQAPAPSISRGVTSTSLASVSEDPGSEGTQHCDGASDTSACSNTHSHQSLSSRPASSVTTARSGANGAAAAVNGNTHDDQLRDGAGSSRAAVAVGDLGDAALVRAGHSSACDAAGAQQDISHHRHQPSSTGGLTGPRWTTAAAVQWLGLLRGSGEQRATPEAAGQDGQQQHAALPLRGLGATGGADGHHDDDDDDDARGANIARSGNGGDEQRHADSTDARPAPDPSTGPAAAAAAVATTAAVPAAAGGQAPSGTSAAVSVVALAAAAPSAVVEPAADAPLDLDLGPSSAGGMYGDEDDLVGERLAMGMSSVAYARQASQREHRLMAAAAAAAAAAPPGMEDESDMLSALDESLMSMSASQVDEAVAAAAAELVGGSAEFDPAPPQASSTSQLVDKWQEPQVRDWLFRIGHSELVSAFEENGISGKALCGLMRMARAGGAGCLWDVLRNQLGMTRLGTQLEFMEELHRLFD